MMLTPAAAKTPPVGCKSAVNTAFMLMGRQAKLYWLSQVYCHPGEAGRHGGVERGGAGSTGHPGQHHWCGACQARRKSLGRGSPCFCLRVGPCCVHDLWIEGGRSDQWM